MPQPNSQHRLHVVFSGGVTGGHLFPGLAVARQLVARDAATLITFVGPGGSFDRERVDRAGFDYVAVDSPRAPRSMLDVAPFGMRMIRGFRDALRVLDSGVSAVVGLGGFASLPAALAASRRHIPVVLLEQNAIMGRANRWLLRRASAACLAFSDTRFSPRSAEINNDPRVTVTGTPVRAAFRIPPLEDHQRTTLLILGGSGGARALNRALPAALRPLHERLRGWEIMHQTGIADESETDAAYRAAGIDATVVPFVDDVAAVLRRARLVISRSGGSTVAELAVARAPAILVPWGAAVDDHQRANALAHALRGAAVMIDGDDADPASIAPRLSAEIAALAGDSARLRQMAAAAGAAATPDAARHVADIIRAQIAQAAAQRTESTPNYLPSPISIDSRAA